VNTLNIHSDNGILASYLYLTALFQRCLNYGCIAGTFLNAEKSGGGHDKKSVTSSFTTESHFYLAVKCRSF